MDPVADLLGDSPAMAALRQQVRGLLDRQASARRFPPILIQGETGTGKGLLAQALHGSSPRRASPFVDINCAAIPETLLEAELFGFERGAFTDARQAKAGLFQSAHGGTIFLDEVALLPESLQGKLLKAIEERAVRRLGGTRSEPVDVWVIAAASEDLTASVRERRFRADLYHRLAVVVFTLPPLRERGDDVLVLAEHFLTSACDEYGLPPKTLGPEARAVLRSHVWPGNVRELHNAIERAVLLSESPAVSAADLGLVASSGDAPPQGEDGPAHSLEDAIREHLVAVLTETGWNISQAAVRLGIARNTLRAWIDKYDLARERAAPPRTAGPRRARVPAASASLTRPAAGGDTVQWERRCLAFLWAEMVTDGDEERSLASSWPIELLAQKVASFGGRVEELGPRGIVAAFGLEASGDAPRRAANAALAIGRAVEQSHRRARTRGRVRAAIDIDEALVGTLGAQVQIDLEAKSRVWTTLRALADAAPPGAIVVTPSAARFLERRFGLADVGRVGAGRAYRVLGGEERRFRPTPFIGRESESASFRRALDTARAGRGQVVAVVGEPGVGKSRLVWEVTRAVGLEGWRVLEGQCVPHGHTIPYLPIVDPGCDVRRPRVGSPRPPGAAAANAGGMQGAVARRKPRRAPGGRGRGSPVGRL